MHGFQRRFRWRICAKVQLTSTDKAEANTSASTRSSGHEGGGDGSRGEATVESQLSDEAEVSEHGGGGVAGPR